MPSTEQPRVATLLLHRYSAVMQHCPPWTACVLVARSSGQNKDKNGPDKQKTTSKDQLDSKHVLNSTEKMRVGTDITWLPLKLLKRWTPVKVQLKTKLLVLTFSFLLLSVPHQRNVPSLCEFILTFGRPPRTNYDVSMVGSKGTSSQSQHLNDNTAEFLTLPHSFQN